MTGEQIAALAAAELPGSVCAVDGTAVSLEVPAASWLGALRFGRDTLRCDFFDWLSAVDEGERGFAVIAHTYSLAGRTHLLARAVVPREAPSLDSATGLYRGAAWHERETHEMFGVEFAGHPGLAPLLLPDGLTGHPLRKEFALTARVDKDWPGAREPGEPGSERIRRRLPAPGVPEEWRQ